MPQTVPESLLVGPVIVQVFMTNTGHGVFHRIVDDVTLERSGEVPAETALSPPERRSRHYSRDRLFAKGFFHVFFPDGVSFRSFCGGGGGRNNACRHESGGQNEPDCATGRHSPLISAITCPLQRTLHRTGAVQVSPFRMRSLLSAAARRSGAQGASEVREFGSIACKDRIRYTEKTRPNRLILNRLC